MGDLCFLVGDGDAVELAFVPPHTYAQYVLALFWEGAIDAEEVAEALRDGGITPAALRLWGMDFDWDGEDDTPVLAPGGPQNGFAAGQADSPASPRNALRPPSWPSTAPSRDTDPPPASSQRVESGIFCSRTGCKSEVAPEHIVESVRMDEQHSAWGQTMAMKKKIIVKDCRCWNCGATWTIEEEA